MVNLISTQNNLQLVPTGWNIKTWDLQLTILVEVFMNHILAGKLIFHESYGVNRTQDYDLKNLQTSAT